VPRANYDNPPAELVRLGATIRFLREREGLKQIQVATGAGMTESQVSDIENAKNNPGWLVLIKLLVEGLDVGLDDFAAAYDATDAAG
jgi:transcriptional regulator with XRE-family HTH domain